MFKAGDKVIAISTNRHKPTVTDLHIGSVYTIRCITEDGFVILEELSRLNHFLIQRFILYTPLMEQLI